MASVLNRTIEFHEMIMCTDFARVSENESIWDGMCRFPRVSKRRGDLMSLSISRANLDLLDKDGLAGEFPPQWSSSVIQVLHKEGRGALHLIGAYQIDAKPHGSFRVLCGYLITEIISCYETLIHRCFVHPKLPDKPVVFGMLDKLREMDFCMPRIVVRCRSRSECGLDDVESSWVGYGFSRHSVEYMGPTDFESKLIARGRA